MQCIQLGTHRVARDALKLCAAGAIEPPGHPSDGTWGRRYQLPALPPSAWAPRAREQIKKHHAGEMISATAPGALIKDAATARRLRELALRQEHEGAVGPCPQDVAGQAAWAQRKAQSDVDLERTLEQERLQKVGS